MGQRVGVLMKHTVVIIDDEPLARRGIRVRLKSFPDFTVLEDCEDGVVGIDAIERHAPDLVFLDVQMPGITGFEMLKRLPKDKHPFIIFLTAYDQYALRAFEVHAVDYLLKPVDSRRFAEAMERARQHLRLHTADSIEERLRGLLDEYSSNQKSDSYLERFAVRTGRRITFVEVDDIDWIEAVGDYACLHVGANRPLLRVTLNTLETRLDPMKLVRIHRSTMVQVSRIKELHTLPNRELRLRLIDGTDLKVSRTFRDRLDRWLSEKSS
jgi:two-component system, LytTR family, response regulator